MTKKSKIQIKGDQLTMTNVNNITFGNYKYYYNY